MWWHAPVRFRASLDYTAGLRVKGAGGRKGQTLGLWDLKVGVKAASLCGLGIDRCCSGCRRMQQQLQESGRVHTRPGEATFGMLSLPMGTTPTSHSPPSFACGYVGVHSLPRTSSRFFCLYNCCQKALPSRFWSIKAYGSRSWSQRSDSDGRVLVAGQ